MTVHDARHADQRSFSLPAAAMRGSGRYLDTEKGTLEKEADARRGQDDAGPVVSPLQDKEYGVVPSSPHCRSPSPSSTPSPFSSPSPSPPPPAALDFPEGGLAAWLVVFGSFCGSMSVFGLINTAAVFESYFAANQLAGYTPSQIGWVFSLYLFIVFFLGIQVGPVFDRYGPRWLVAVGSVLVCASLFLLSISETFYQIILTYSVVGGLGGALLYTPSYGVIAHFFDARRGLATGIATTSGGVGGIVFPILLRSLLPTLGFAWSCRVLGFILLGLAVPANLLIRARLKPILPGKDGGNNNNNNGNPTATPNADADDGAVASASAPIPSSVWPDLHIFRDKRYALAATGIIFTEFGLFVPITFIVSYASAHGQAAGESYLLLSWLNAGSVAGRVLPGLVADRCGRFNTVLATLGLCVAAVLGLWLPAGDSRPALAGFAVLFGFASGSNLGLIPVCLGQLCDSRAYGRYLSTALMVASFGTLSSVPVGGALLQIGGAGGADGDGGESASAAGWEGLIIFSGAAYAVAFVLYGTARVLAVGWDPRVKF